MNKTTKSKVSFFFLLLLLSFSLIAMISPAYAAPIADFGNKFGLQINNAWYPLSASDRKVSVRFTNIVAQSVSWVSVFVHTSTSSPTYRVGIQFDDGSANHFPNGTWTGSSHTAYYDKVLSANWNNGTLGNVPSLAASTIYHIVIQYQSGTIDASHFIAVRGVYPIRLYHTYDSTSDTALQLIGFDGSSWSTNPGGYDPRGPIFVIKGMYGGPSQGQPYDSEYCTDIQNADSHIGRERWLHSGTDGAYSVLGIYGYKVGSPSANLHVVLNDVSTSTQLFTVDYAPGDWTSTWQFYNKTVTAFSLIDGHTYDLILSSTGGDSSNHYKWEGGQSWNATYEKLNWFGSFGSGDISINNGQSWASWKADFGFFFQGSDLVLSLDSNPIDSSVMLNSTAFSDGFESGTFRNWDEITPITGWIIASNGTPSSYNSHSGSYKAYASTPAYLYSDYIDLSSADSFRISFWYMGYNLAADTYRMFFMDGLVALETVYLNPPVNGVWYQYDSGWRTDATFRVSDFSMQAWKTGSVGTLGFLDDVLVLYELEESTSIEEVMHPGTTDINFPSSTVVDGVTWHFIHWDDNTSNTDPSRSLSLSYNTSLSVLYGLYLNLTAVSSPHPTFTLNGSKQSTPYSQIEENGTYTIVFIASYWDSGNLWEFSHWNDNESLTNPTRVIQLQNNTAYAVTYEPKSFYEPYVDPLSLLTQYLTAGDFIGLFLAIFSYAFMGEIAFFYTLIVFAIGIILYIRFKSVLICFVFWIACGSAIAALVPYGVVWGVFLGVISVGTLLFKLFMSRRGIESA